MIVTYLSFKPLFRSRQPHSFYAKIFLYMRKYTFLISGIWGGGFPKPFKYTEIQRHRFNLADREGVADRKVPLQPLVFSSADGSTKRYNLRKVNRTFSTAGAENMHVFRPTKT